MTTSTYQNDSIDLSHVRREVDLLIAQAKEGCVDRGVDPITGKRGKCHAFLSNSDICLCEDKIDLSKERMK